MQDETQQPVERLPQRVEVRLGTITIPTVAGLTPCPGCSKGIRIPVVHGDPPSISNPVHATTITTLQAGGEVACTCQCGQPLLLYVSRVRSMVGDGNTRRAIAGLVSKGHRKR